MIYAAVHCIKSSSQAAKGSNEDWETLTKPLRKEKQITYRICDILTSCSMRQSFILVFQSVSGLILPQAGVLCPKYYERPLCLTPAQSALYNPPWFQRAWLPATV